MKLTPLPLKSLEITRSAYILMHTMSNIVFRIREVVQLGTDLIMEKKSKIFVWTLRIVLVIPRLCNSIRNAKYFTIISS